MANPTSLSLCLLSNVCFFAASIIFINDAQLSPLITGEARSIIGSILLTIPPILSSSLVFLRRFAPESSILNLKLSYFGSLVLSAFYEYVLALGFGLCAIGLLASSIVMGWNHLFAIFFISIHFAISSRLIGNRSPVKAAMSTVALMMLVGFDVGNTTHSVLPIFVSVEFIVVVAWLVYQWRMEDIREKIAKVKEV